MFELQFNSRFKIYPVTSSIESIFVDVANLKTLRQKLYSTEYKYVKWILFAFVLLYRSALLIFKHGFEVI